MNMVLSSPISGEGDPEHLVIYGGVSQVSPL